MFKQQMKSTILVMTLVTMLTAQETGLKTVNLESAYLELEQNHITAVFCKITVFKGEHNISHLFTTPGSLLEDDTPKNQKSIANSAIENTQELRNSLKNKRILAEQVNQVMNTPTNQSTVLADNQDGTLMGKVSEERNTSNIGPLHTLFLDCVQPKVEKSEKEQFGGLCQPDKQKLRVRLVSKDGVAKMDYETDLDRESSETNLYFLEKQQYNENNGIIFDEDACLLLIKFSSILQSIAVALAVAFV